jgi:pimeloyl-ACP methyl ester carboxylesterase
MRFVTTAEVDWSDSDAAVEYLLGYERVLAGPKRDFDEAASRALIRRDVERARDFAARQNHDMIDQAHSDQPLSSIGVPTLVIHGSADPMFPIEHGRALAREIPEARLLELEGAGHGIDPADRQTIADAILKHTDGGA